MIRIPALRFGKPYTSMDKAVLTHHATGEPHRRLKVQRNAQDVDATNDDLGGGPARIRRGGGWSAGASRGGR